MAKRAWPWSGCGIRIQGWIFGVIKVYIVLVAFLFYWPFCHWPFWFLAFLKIGQMSLAFWHIAFLVFGQMTPKSVWLLKPEIVLDYSKDDWIFTSRPRQVILGGIFSLTLDDLQSCCETYVRLPSTEVKCSCSRPPEGVLGTTPPTNFHICSNKCLLV